MDDQNHLVHKIGNGLNTSLWFDNWHAICPLSDFISKRKKNIPVSLKIVRLLMWLIMGSGNGLVSLLRSLTVSLLCPHVLIDDKEDNIMWRSKCSRHIDFSVSKVWDDIRDSSHLVSWANLVWLWYGRPYMEDLKLGIKWVFGRGMMI
ncbi:hypothetical protein Tco_1507316 [Tanacetum coccineum]